MGVLMIPGKQFAPGFLMFHPERVNSDLHPPTLAVHSGLGRDIWTLTPEEITEFLRVRVPLPPTSSFPSPSQ